MFCCVSEELAHKNSICYDKRVKCFCQHALGIPPYCLLKCAVAAGERDSVEATLTYVVGQLSSRTRHRVLAVAALDRSLSMV
jgi:hypothetical protein